MCLSFTCRSTHILVRDNLDVLHVSGGLKDLLENIFRNARVQASNVQRSFVGFRSRSADAPSAAGGRQDTLDGGGNRAVVLRDVDVEIRGRRRWHTSAILAKAGGRGRLGGVGHGLYSRR